jgi:hypothetical protein
MSQNAHLLMFEYTACQLVAAYEEGRQSSASKTTLNRDSNAPGTMAASGTRRVHGHQCLALSGTGATCDLRDTTRGARVDMPTWRAKQCMNKEWNE